MFISDKCDRVFDTFRMSNRKMQFLKEGKYGVEYAHAIECRVVREEKNC